MAKGNPHADASTGARYLPGYERQVIGAHGPNTGLDTSGFQYHTKLRGEFWRDVEVAAKSLTGVAQTYYAIREQRDIRDTETLIDSTLRQRKLDIFSSTSGKGADNLIESEKEWVEKTREDIIKQSGLGNVIANTLWEKKSQDYLTRVGAHMLEQNRAAEEQSKFAAVVGAQDDLAMSPVGDFKAYAQYSAKVASLYGHMSKEGIKAREQGIDVLIDSWTAQNPNATLGWFNQNKDGLREVLGREFSDVSRAMDRVHNRLESQMRKAEMQAQRSERLERQAQKEKDEKWESEQITKILADDNDIDIRQTVKDGAANGVSGDKLLVVQKVFENRENVSLKSTSSTVRGMYQGKALEDGLTSEDRQSLIAMLADKKILPSDFQAIISADDRTKKAEAIGLRDIRKSAVQQLRTAIAPRGGLDQVNQTAEYAFNQYSRQLDIYVDSLDSPEAKRAALDIANPKSYVSQLITAAAAGKSPIDRKREAYSMEPFNPNKPIKLPEDKKARPGESFEDWEKRTGG